MRTIILILQKFGVRNFEEIEKSISEAYRVLKKDGIIVIMEPSTKNNKFLSFLSKFYFEVIVTNIGYLFSKIHLHITIYLSL